MPNLIKIRISVVWRYMKIIWIREHKKCHDNITIYENSLQKFTLLVWWRRIVGGSTAWAARTAGQQHVHKIMERCCSDRETS